VPIEMAIERALTTCPRTETPDDAVCYIWTANGPTEARSCGFAPAAWPRRRRAVSG